MADFFMKLFGSDFPGKKSGSNKTYQILKLREWNSYICLKNIICHHTFNVVV